jgi:levanase
MSVPREVNLRTIAGRPQLVSEPVDALDELLFGWPYTRDDVTVSDRTLALTDRRARGKALDLRVTLEPRSADVAGLRVRVGNGQQTVIGYDARSQEVFVDRTRSGDASFSADFASSVQRAPLRARHGKVHLRLLVDWSSVEVFAQGGVRVITNQIYPDASSDGVELFATGGRARFDDLTIHRMASIWHGRDGRG